MISHLLHLESVGFLADGLADWAAAATVLRGSADYHPQPLVVPPLARLPAAERRRITPCIALALAAVEQALGERAQVADLQYVFASSYGDMAIADALCRALALPDRPVSPTRFHNSVHNAPAGYWSLAAQTRAPATSICLEGGSLAAGLLEAVVQAVAEGVPVLLVAYEYPAPAPLNRVVPLIGPCAVALVLAPAGNGPCLRVGGFEAARVSRLDNPLLEALRTGNDAAQVLPLLKRVACAQPGPVWLPYLDDRALRIEMVAGDGG